MNNHHVLTCIDVPLLALEQLLARFGITLIMLEKGAIIEGSYWGEAEAGLVQNRVYVRPDTPIHSLLHEACHYICMDKQRRDELHTDAGGEYIEENGVCYLQIVLADYIPTMDKARMWADMDAWGYTFRLGSSQAWFEEDATDAKMWLIEHQLLDMLGYPTWKVRA
ncbi:hypothetical protein [Beggiatoa leptomitoformis]|uniref:ImmA/IrrE family metallo-endopeptidase n=1 Tax=Beggiatoa leptomitoformis TaxID=288004 RepID=A0A2N9YEX5_9GAMM|nr:hypothetical protein [Beggiatoa leptomitoformis]ALG68617.1 hypothetical protein AL038_14030 [Beggiatoa leptomitoformis]AUI69037.1 hypothetical protein BLE401_10225 [Beggiatoa leptomitoformis]